MAKLIFENGMLIEGTVYELMEFTEFAAEKFGVKPAEEKKSDDYTDQDSLKVGDYVVPIESADDKYFITNTEMKLGKVVEVDVDCCDDIRIEVVAHEDDGKVGKSYSVEPKYFRKATDEEVKWAKIGRKPCEFKKGDIVRVVEYTGAHEAGEIVELVEDGARSYRDKDGKRLVGRPIWFELVATVESRVDLVKTDD